MGWSRSPRPGVPLPSQFVLLLQEAVICCEPALQFWLKMTVQNPIKAVHVPESLNYIHIFVSKRHLRAWELPGMPRVIAVICWCPQTGSSESSTDPTMFVCPESPGTERKSREDGIALLRFFFGWVLACCLVPVTVLQKWDRSGRGGCSCVSEK